MSNRELRIACMAVVMGGVVAPQIAHADCEANMVPLAKQLETTTDERVKTRLFLALRRARMELDEFDEVECQQALDAATKLLQAGR